MSTPYLSLAVSEEKLGDNAPVLFQDGIIRGMQSAKDLGFTGVEIHIRNPGQIDEDSLLAAEKDLDIKICAVGTGLEYGLNKLSFTSDNPEIRQKTRKRFMEHIDLASKLNASVFVGLCRGTAPDYASIQPYLERFAQELLPLQEYADSKQVVLTLEPIAYYMTNLLNTVDDCLDFMARPGFEKLQLLLDTHHMFLEDKDMYGAAFDKCAGKIGHFHVSDSNRRHPGAGNVDFDKVAEKLKQIGYDRPVSLEVLPHPSGTEASRLCMEWMRRYWQIGIK
ncbi:sugar phosphate isomerase/epimerase family protein [Marispirochaeta sp.]|uniref:sugar phosphate isomerase/epimerase family protein n=1 Tax=Marispirochaeta sp. TaxID=2038653 RepID=UPI0029C68CC1|nr:sugar phosphate isomerase/epimerase family protein [Marispirochaeta sp.]